MPIKKILVVDDSPTERLALSEVLVKNGYQVVTAESGDEAVVKSKSEHPDLILMDVVMPGQNGFQLTRAITRDPRYADVPVIMCTSKGQETDKIWGLRQGAQDYMVKPINPEELLAFVREVRLERLGVFPYSEEEGTWSAENLRDDIPETIKQQRAERVMALQNEISLENNRRRVGRTERVIIDSRQGDWYVGRTQYDSPEVDQELLIPAGGRRLRRGCFYEARITAAEEYDLYGELTERRKR